MLFQEDTPELARFRAEVRAWHEDNLPHAWRDLLALLDPDIQRAWHRKLHERGWVAPHWPKSEGGMGASLDEQLVLLEEQLRIGAPYLFPTGLNLLGPTLIAFGTPVQKAKFLPGILSGKTIWAQGYSETEAGSDLASLRTTARGEAGHFVVDGHKIWSSYGYVADWMFALVRTDPRAVARQAGISLLLIDLRSPGVSVRPIRTIAGHDELSEVHFDGVLVPQDNLVGPLHGGWQVANHVLVSERLANGSPRHALLTWRKVVKVARASGMAKDRAFADRLCEAEVTLVAYLACYRQAVESVKANRSIDALAPVLKIRSTELVQRFSELLLEAAGEQGAQTLFALQDGSAIELAGTRLLARRTSIYGGSNEIQRNILATRVLGMPKSW